MNIKEICPVHKKCGGCHYQGVSYEEQLRVKEKMVGKLMGKFCKVHPIVGMENPYHCLLYTSDCRTFKTDFGKYYL